jgi:hypothetical protein
MHLAAVHGMADGSTALLPRASHRWWLAVNIVGALAINHFIYTNWQQHELAAGLVARK